MKAVCWQGAKQVQVNNVPDPTILNPRDAIIKITSTAICGSDLHLYDGFNPTMQPGDILGHEFMGEIVELGSGIRNKPRPDGSPALAVGDRVVVPFTISCGSCFFCNRQLWSLCDNSNPNAWMAEKLMGYSPSGLFGYSHLTGGYAGGQAEYARVPFADVGLFKIPGGLTDEQVLFLTDIFPTGYMAAENCDIQPGDTVAIWGCGPVGLFAIKSAFMLGAERVIAIDLVPERLQMAKDLCGAEVLNMEEVDVGEALKEMTGGRGPDAVMDAVGMEAHGTGLEGFYDRVKQAARLETDRPTVLRQAIVACRKGGTVSVPGVYTGFVDKVPMGAFMNKGLTMKTGQTHLHRYLKPLLERIQSGDIDPTFLITHRLPLEQAPHAYEIFKHKQDNCIKVILKPGQVA
ncbi:MAG: glutathione-dependent formaldehyde dehydrogenase [Oculatellaceae cyanobacterium Prado106]|jgi:threonine dehydrogenase-like Zn-dependent dehydrogenase|nr:glutathione-dependent formaldehyde dehydrogenase [Oculatellaceae cyanobacterium Prado106]